MYLSGTALIFNFMRSTTKWHICLCKQMCAFLWVLVLVLQLYSYQCLYNFYFLISTCRDWHAGGLDRNFARATQSERPMSHSVSRVVSIPHAVTRRRYSPPWLLLLHGISHLGAARGMVSSIWICWKKETCLHTHTHTTWQKQQRHWRTKTISYP